MRFKFSRQVACCLRLFMSGRLQTSFPHGVGSCTGWVILSHACQHDALYPCRVVYLHGFGVKKC